MSRVRPDIVTVEMVLELMEKSDSKKQHMDPSLFGSRGAVFQHEFAICSGHSSGVRPTHSASFNHDLSEGGRETGEQSAPINPLLSLSRSSSGAWTSINCQGSLAEAPQSQPPPVSHWPCMTLGA